MKKRREKTDCGAPNRRTFTLNELLFIVFVFLLLASLLAPSLIEINVLYKQTSCTDNLIVLAKENMLYAEDGGHYAPASLNAQIRWHGALREDINKRPDITKSPLRPYMKGLRALRPCPLFEDIADASAPAPEKGGGGYGYNENIGSLRAVQTDYDLWEEQCRQAGILPSELSLPRGTVMFAETATKANSLGALDFSGNFVENSFCKSYDTYNRGRPAWGTPVPTIHFRHSGRALVAWCDGHISSESPGGSKDDWIKVGIGFVGTRTSPGFVPRTPSREEAAHE